MAMIRLIKGGTFFGHIVEYNWKGKFLVVEIGEGNTKQERRKRIVSWDNVESVFQPEHTKVVSE